MPAPPTVVILANNKIVKIDSLVYILNFFPNSTIVSIINYGARGDHRFPPRVYSIFSLHRHLPSKARFVAFKLPIPSPPLFLSRRIFFHATQLILLVWSISPQKNLRRRLSKVLITLFGAL